MESTNPQTPGKNNTKISLAEAKKRVKKWLKVMSGMPEFKEQPQTIPRALFIPLEDIKELLSDYENAKPEEALVGIRVYFGLKEVLGAAAESYELDGMLVPVLHESEKKPHVDGIYKDKNAPNPEETNIYDFTAPCPRYCDTSSELFLPIE